MEIPDGIQTRYNDCKIILRKVFTEGQADLILESFLNHGLLAEEDNDVMSKIRFLNNYWLQKAWSDIMIIDFQTMLIKHPELDGAREVFKSHPVARTFLRSESEVAAASVSSENDNNTTRARPTLTGLKHEISKMEEKAHRARKYLVHEVEEVDDPESLDFKYAQFQCEGVMYEWSCNEFTGVRIKLGYKFHLLRSMRVTVPCIATIEAYEQCYGRPSMKDAGVLWSKQIKVEPNMWNNFCDQLLPCHSSLFNVGVTFVPIEGADRMFRMPVVFRGVRLMPRFALELEDFIKSEGRESVEFDPHEYGFSEHF